MIELKFTPAQDQWLEVTWADKGKEVKHTSYHPTQLDLLQADAAAMGTPLDDHAEMLAEWVADYVPPAPTPPTFADFEAALTAHLDATAKARRWDSRITLAVRAGYPNPWQQEAIAFGTWMDTCNAMGYQLLAEVQAGTRPLPATTQELIDALPVMVWPAA
jgi:hypothetical protein